MLKQERIRDGCEKEWEEMTMTIISVDCLNPAESQSPKEVRLRTGVCVCIFLSIVITWDLASVPKGGLHAAIVSIIIAILKISTATYTMPSSLLCLRCSRDGQRLLVGIYIPESWADKSHNTLRQEDATVLPYSTKWVVCVRCGFRKNKRKERYYITGRNWKHCRYWGLCVSSMQTLRRSPRKRNGTDDGCCPISPINKRHATSNRRL